MKPVVIDFETYYDNDYTLRKLKTEEYIRDPRFKAHGVGVYEIGGEGWWWLTGDIGAQLAQLQLDKRAVLAHHAHFDGLILSHHYGIYPKAWLDTLSMARALGLPRLDLDTLAVHFGVGAKPADRLQATAGIRDLSPGLLASLGEYCENDCMLTAFLFDVMKTQFPVSELRIIDAVVKMFTAPSLRIDADMATATALAEVARTDELLRESGIERETLMSNPQFAELLRSLGVEPPTKVSPKTQKETWAFSKADKEFTALLDHPEPLVQAAVAARLGVKSTIVRTRAEAFAGIAKRTPKDRKDTGWPVYLRYSGARQTHRLSGADGVNPQNLNRGSLLRKAVHAPDGHIIVAGDSSNIELRVNMTLAGQRDVIEALRAGRDLYCEFASQRYGREITKKNKAERQYGKICHLALGYGMGATKFVDTARLNGLLVDDGEAQHTVQLYRSMFPMVPTFWNRARDAIPHMLTGQEVSVDSLGMVVTEARRLVKPSGMPLLYQQLTQRRKPDGSGFEWVYAGYDEETGRPQERRLYGGKLVENIVQSVARDIVCEQMATIAERYRVAMQVHDEVVCVVPRKQADECAAFMLSVMSTPPAWFPEVPLAAEVDFSFRYGDCK